MAHSPNFIETIVISTRIRLARNFASYPFPKRMDDAQAAATGQDVSAFITAYVAEHYMEELTLKDLSARLNYSLPYISKRFKEDVGVSFVHYLQNYRVMEGCRLLSSSNRSLSEITEMVGYRDVKFFAEMIKRYTGVSPREYRKKHRRED